MNRIKSSNWRPEVGLLDLIGEDGATITMPIGALDGLNKMASRVMGAHANTKGENWGDGWRQMTTLPVETAKQGPCQRKTGRASFSR